MAEGASFSVEEAIDLLWCDEGAWMESDIPARPWIAPGYALRGALTIVSGPPGVSKSSLMLSYAVAAALGEDFHRFRPIGPMKVMVFNVEDDALEQRRRLSAVLRRFGRPPADIAGRVIRVGPSGVATLASYEATTGQVSPTPAMSALRNLIEAHRPDMVILDPFSELHSAEENANTAVRAVLAFFRSLAAEMNLAVILLHHTRKGAAIAGDPDAARGASAIIGAARIVLTVTGMTEDEARAFGISADARRHLFRLDAGKANYSPPSEVEWFERIAYPLDNGEAVAAAAPWAPPVDIVAPDTRNRIELDIAGGSPLGPWSAKLSADERSVRNVLERHGITTLAGQKALIGDLLSAGWSVAVFRRESRGTGRGLKSPDGKPSAVQWLDEDGAS